MTGPFEIALLRKILSLAKHIEQVAQDQKFPEAKLAELIVLLSELSRSEDPDYHRLGDIQEHLHPGMTLRHFVNFMIPVERRLGVSLSDGDIVVHSQDRAASVGPRRPLVFVLDHLRSAFNVGSIFRLADSLNVGGVYLCGYTPEANEKTALGAEKTVPFEKRFRLEDALLELKDRGDRVYVLETSPQATGLYETDFFSQSESHRTALVVGNERFGMDPHTLESGLRSGYIEGVISIPMAGQKNSLNVACALSVVAYEWQRQYVKASRVSV